VQRVFGHWCTPLKGWSHRRDAPVLLTVMTNDMNGVLPGVRSACHGHKRRTLARDVLSNVGGLRSPSTVRTMGHRAAILFVLFAGASRAWPQAAPPTRLPIPTTELGIRDWGTAIIRRTAALLASADEWNRGEAGPCKPDASTYTLR